MSEEKKKLLKLMSFWLFGTFIIVWAAITMYIGLFVNKDWWLAITTGFPIWGITFLFCIIFYFGYKAYLSKKKEA